MVAVNYYPYRFRAPGTSILRVRTPGMTILSVRTPGTTILSVRTSWAWPDLCVNGRSGVNKPIPGFVLAARNLAAPIRLQYSSIQTADYVIGYSMLARILFAMDVNRFIC